MSDSDSGQWSWARFEKQCRADANTVLRALPATADELRALGLSELRLRLAQYRLTRELGMAYWADGRLVRGRLETRNED